MTQPVVVGTPDYSTPPDATARLVLNVALDLSAGGIATTADVLVSQFTGVLFEISPITAAANFGNVQISFRDTSGGPFVVPTYTAFYRGDKPLKLNVPVMGQLMRVQVVGPVSINTFTVSAIGHGGSGQSSHGRGGLVLAHASGSLAVGATSVTDLSQIREGPATLLCQKNVQDMRAWVTSYDSGGAPRVIAEAGTIASDLRTVPFWLPPTFCQLSVMNAGGGTDTYEAVATVGRE